MGRWKPDLHRRSIWMGLNVMTPIPELPEEEEEEESNRPLTPIADSDEACERPEISPKAPEAEIVELNTNNSFTDHLHGLVEQYTEELISKDKQLRKEEELSSGLWVEYQNYRMSWLMDRTEKIELYKQLEKLATEAEERKQEMKAEKKIDAENEKLKKKVKQLKGDLARMKESYDNVLEENKEMKRVRNVIEGEENIRGKSKNSRGQRSPKAPIVPSSPLRYQRRPNTGKSRDQSSLLPPISENNKVTRSPSAVSPLQSPVLPPFSSPKSPLVPTPPKQPRASNSVSGRRRSQIPLVFPPIRGASSVSNLLHTKLEKTPREE